ncbi:hypothetical protein QAD02_010009 [Eretmocerus hayati]|uniref:Uncharacterized protein n=1 Tax=Eretmocerus hayati TaxID=131215 RepID=A0ACC2NBA2_9HYME|nr:hypothetical protein QAD02_010009 [Eretmocerus hayati]
MLKLTSIIVSILASFLIFANLCLAKDLKVGNRQPGDKLVSLEVVELEYKWYGTKIVEERTYRVPKGNIITFVHSIDQATDDTGAEAVVTGGGPGQDWVQIKFKSQRLHGVYHTVNIYAKHA